MADDLLQGLKDKIDNAPPEEDPRETLNQFMKALADMPGLTEEDKENLLKSLLQGGPAGPKQDPQAALTNPFLEFLLLFGLISVVILGLGFIGYKLYNNAIEREKKKELKKLQKEQKKKK